jgi:hypothetical protein
MTLQHFLEAVGVASLDELRPESDGLDEASDEHTSEECDFP